ncbi:MAG: diguanylate cyclase [Lachnospiraceae bacterium]|nr:diguanylate cyclase [Lachnospiraceae bacterium]
MINTVHEAKEDRNKKDVEISLKKKGKKRKRLSGFNMSLLKMTLIPLMLLGIIVSIIVYISLSDIMYSEVEEELKNTSLIVQHTFEYAYPGDYAVVGKDKVAVVKGEKVLNGEYSLIDNIKKETDSEVTFFYGNTRILSTIRDDNGERVIGSTIRQSVVDQVLVEGKGNFYDDIIIDNKTYFAYYLPIRNSDNTCIGMVAILKQKDAVRKKIISAIMPAIIIVILGMIIMTVISYKYSSKLIKRISKVKNFLIKTSNGDFAVHLDEIVLKHHDEISEMGRLAVSMQASLRNMVEQDALTGMNNRRYGDKILLEVHQKYKKSGRPFSVAIADIDLFKLINDTYGHNGGDYVLKEIAGILKDKMSDLGFAVRWGGEEFLLVFDGIELDRAHEYLTEIVDIIRNKEIIYNGHKIKITVTCGITAGNDNPVHLIVKAADKKLYEGKQNGRNRIVR